jgi:hypothetical protein
MDCEFMDEILLPRKTYRQSEQCNWAVLDDGTPGSGSFIFGQTPTTVPDASGTVAPTRNLGVRVLCDDV